MGRGLSRCERLQTRLELSGDPVTETLAPSELRWPTIVAVRHLCDVLDTEGHRTLQDKKMSRERPHTVTAHKQPGAQGGFDFLAKDTC